MVSQNKDYTTPVLAVVAASALGLGAWLMFRKTGAEPGDTITAVFSFNYRGDGGTYIFEVSLGTIVPIFGFDHLEGLTWNGEMELSTVDELGNQLPRPIHFNVKMPVTLPQGTKAKTYDLEAGIRLPGSQAQDFLPNAMVRVDNALVVKVPK